MSDHLVSGFAPPAPRIGGALAEVRKSLSRLPWGGSGGGFCGGEALHVRWLTMARAAWRRHRTRQYLAELDGYLLRDIGVTRTEAEIEANKPFWVR